MEFEFDVSAVIPDEISIISTDTYSNGTASNSVFRQQLDSIIDTAGYLSAQAQGLRQTITSAAKLRSSDHTIYLMRATDGGTHCVVGMLKVGRKKLFLLDGGGVQVEVRPLCVLDFYVHHSHQRHGYGLALFSFMLEHEHVPAHHLAIDRPSPKLISFMRKHFKLTDQIPQVINFTIYKGFFDHRPEPLCRHSSIERYRLDDVYGGGGGGGHSPGLWLYRYDEVDRAARVGTVLPNNRLINNTTYNMPLSRVVQEREALKTVNIANIRSFSHTSTDDISRSSTPDNEHISSPSRHLSLVAHKGKYSRHSFTAASPVAGSTTSPRYIQAPWEKEDLTHNTFNHQQSARSRGSLTTGLGGSNNGRF